MLPPGSVVQPINAQRGDSMEQMRRAAMEAYPRMQARARHAGIVPMAEGGTVSAPANKFSGFDWSGWLSKFRQGGAWRPGGNMRIQPARPLTPEEIGRQTAANVLRRVFDPNQDIRPGQAWGVQPKPVFGVNVPDPTQMAYSYSKRPHDARLNMESGWGLAGYDPETVQERIRAVTPTAVRPFNVAYGYDGLAVRPV